jgi:hypothetical protein
MEGFHRQGSEVAGTLTSIASPHLRVSSFFVPSIAIGALVLFIF